MRSLLKIQVKLDMCQSLSGPIQNNARLVTTLRRLSKRQSGPLMGAIGYLDPQCLNAVNRLWLSESHSEHSDSSHVALHALAVTTLQCLWRCQSVANRLSRPSGFDTVNRLSLSKSQSSNVTSHTQQPWLFAHGINVIITHTFTAAQHTWLRRAGAAIVRLAQQQQQQRRAQAAVNDCRAARKLCSSVLWPVSEKSVST